MVQKEVLRDVFTVHVRLLVLPRVSISITTPLLFASMLTLSGLYHVLLFCSLLLWAPFLNFRKFPRDPSMKYPWDKPKDPSTIKNDYLKYPFAKPEDYDY